MKGSAKVSSVGSSPEILGRTGDVQEKPQPIPNAPIDTSKCDSRAKLFKPKGATESMKSTCEGRHNLRQLVRLLHADVVHGVQESRRLESSHQQLDYA